MIRAFLVFGRLLKNYQGLTCTKHNIPHFCIMHRFYANNLDIESILVELNEIESTHACKVLRLKIGDIIEVFNGTGMIALAQIENNHAKRCSIKILSVEQHEKQPGSVHIAICPTKSSDRFEWFLEKAVEIGVDEITPLHSENSERSKLNYERLDKIMMSAVKQSQRLYVPILNPLAKVSEFIKSNPNCLMAHCNSKMNRIEIMSIPKIGRSTIMIGPEGDFSEKEIQQAIEQKINSVSLGKNRLRTETAGVVAATLLKQWI